MRPSRPEFDLRLRDAGDPLARHGRRPRDATYRLKQLLKAIGRGWGFRVTRAAPVRAPIQEPKETAKWD